MVRWLQSTITAAAAATLMTGMATAAQKEATPQAVAEQYADVAHATYEDALITAKALDAAIDRLLQTPSEQTLAAAKAAWKEARVPYQQSEVFRFGNEVVDEWDGQLNAWPLDEGLIDYVQSANYQHEMGNPGVTANIVAAKELKVGGKTLDVSKITPELLAELNELGGSEANVATGYHAIEFLLWGQDLNGFKAGSGARPYTDFAKGKDCTGGNCERRGQYLQAASDLLIKDLEWMTGQWSEGKADNYRAKLLAMEPKQIFEKMLYGMGSLSLGELAGERMKVALEANSYEDEHDCFSDNTHNSHFYDGKGIQNVYLGQYKRVNGNMVEGPSLSDLVRKSDAKLDQKMRAELTASMNSLQAMVDSAEAKQAPMPFDMMIAPKNEKGEQLVRGAMKALVAQTGTIEQVAAALGIQQLKPDTADHQF